MRKKKCLFWFMLMCIVLSLLCPMIYAETLDLNGGGGGGSSGSSGNTTLTTLREATNNAGGAVDKDISDAAANATNSFFSTFVDIGLRVFFPVMILKVLLDCFTMLSPSLAQFTCYSALTSQSAGADGIGAGSSSGKKVGFIRSIFTCTSFGEKVLKSHGYIGGNGGGIGATGEGIGGSAQQSGSKDMLLIDYFKEAAIFLICLIFIWVMWFTPVGRILWTQFITIVEHIFGFVSESLGKLVQ